MAKTDDSYTFPKATAPRTKSGVLDAVSNATGLPRKHVGKVLGALAALVAVDMARHGGFTLNIIDFDRKLRCKPKILKERSEMNTGFPAANYSIGLSFGTHESRIRSNVRGSRLERPTVPWRPADLF